MSGAPKDPRRRSNRALLARLTIVAVVMFGFGYAMIPFYDQICKATGLRDIAVADTVRNTQVDTGRAIRIELDANVSAADLGDHEVDVGGLGDQSDPLLDLVGHVRHDLDGRAEVVAAALAADHSVIDAAGSDV